jgi:hypothetical protein
LSEQATADEIINGKNTPDIQYRDHLIVDLKEVIKVPLNINPKLSQV